MTPNEKRAHLALHGFRACTMRALDVADLSEYAWRLYVLDDPAQRNVTKLGRGWRAGRMSSNASLYTQRELSEVPDDLLDSLDLSLIEQLCSPFDPSF